MAGANYLAESAYPDLRQYRNVEDKLDAVQGYMFQLLEYLRWLLRNLSQENFNDAEVSKWVEQIADTVVNEKVIISETVITNELYADYGAIADLTVDELRTDYMRAARYLAGDTDPIDYIHIHDEVIDFRTGTVGLDEHDQPLTEQLHHGDRYFWWRDETRTQMTSLEDTGLPVTVYRYDEQLKGTIRFDTVLQSGQQVRIPQFVFGTGYGYADPDRGKGFIRKNLDSFDVWLLTAAGERHGMFIGDEYTDLVGLRKTTEIDFSGWDGGSFTETVDGGITETFAVSFDANGRPVKITDGDGHETAVAW